MRVKFASLRHRAVIVEHAHQLAVEDSFLHERRERVLDKLWRKDALNPNVADQPPVCGRARPNLPEHAEQLLVADETLLHREVHQTLAQPVSDSYGVNLSG